MELDPVTQNFYADTAPYISAVEAAVAATDAFKTSVEEALIAVEALGAAIDDLPELKVINIRVETTGMPEAAAAAEGAGAEGAAPDTAGFREAENAVDDLDDAFARLDDILKEQGGDWEEVDLGAGNAAESLDATRAAYRDLVEQGVDPVSAAFTAVRENGGGVTEVMRAAAESTDEATDAYERLDRAFAMAAQGLEYGNNAFADIFGNTERAASAADDGAARFSRFGLTVNTLADDVYNLDRDAGDTAAGFGLLGSAANGIVNGFARVEETWKNTNVVWGLSLNALHWIVMGSMELLAVAVPAMVALGAAGLVAMQGVQETSNRLESIYTVTESLGGAFNQTAGQVLGMGDKLQQAQNAADPLVWEALGGAISAVNSRGGNFIQMGTGVLGIFDRWVASIDIQLQGAFGARLTGLVSQGTQDLVGFGQAFGNLGHFITNVASEMPGLAEVLLGAVAGFTKLLTVLTEPAWYNFGGNLVTVAMGIEEAWRWGGLLAPVLGKASSGLSSLALNAATGLEGLSGFGRGAEESEEALTGWRAAAAGASEGALGLAGGLESTAAVLTGPWGWVILGAAAGLTLLAIKLNSTRSAAQQFVAQLETTINNANITQGFTDVGNSLNKLGDQYSKASTAAAAAGQKVNVANDGFGRASSVMNTAAGSAAVFAGGMSMVAQHGVEMIDAGEKISSKFGISLPAAFEAADLAGVKVGQMFQANGQISATALQQIQNYINGYKAMSGNAGALSNNIDAVNVQIGLQDSKVGQLNQAWDQFTANAVGGTAAWAGLKDDLQQIGNTASIVGGKITAFNGTVGLSTKQVSQALTSFGGASAQVWQSFDGSITQANKNLDWWRTAAASGAASSTQLTQATATTAGSFLPYVKNSQAALSETMMIAQQQGGPAYKSSLSLAQNYQALNDWVQKNSVSQSQYNQMLNGATTALSNVNQQAQQFSQTMQGDVSQAIISGSGALATVTKDTQNFSSALKNNVPQSNAVAQAISALTTQLVHDGYNASSTASMIYQLTLQQTGNKTIAKELADQAYKTANAILKSGGAANTATGDMNGYARSEQNAAAWADGLGNAVRNIPSQKTIQIAIQQSGSVGAITASVGQRTAGYATGFRVPGYGGGDIHPALLEGGEAVVPKELSPAVAPFLKSHGVPGFEGGGIMGSGGSHASMGGGGGAPQTIHVPVYIDGSKIAEAMVPYSAAAAGRYQVRNSGRATGQWGTGWKG